jgi:hypothetical protein
MNGAPDAAHVFIPSPIVGKSSEELLAYISGDSPISGRPVMEEVIAGLTIARDQGDTRDESGSRLLDPAPEDELHELFLERGLTDQLPIVLPTEERVAAMLAGTSRSPDEIVSRIVRRGAKTWESTVEKVAVNAVMAGARPEYLPVILALASTNVSARHSSTTALAGTVIVNGPIRSELRMGAGIGAMGPYHHANATIGRAWGLLSQNLQGGSVPGVSYMGSQGNAYAFTNVCFAENEEASPWEPFHVQHGFARNESVVSALLGARTMIFSLGLPDATWQETLRRTLSAADLVRGPVLLLDPLVARGLVDLGFASKQQLAEWIAENVSIPAREFWELSLAKLAYLPRAHAGEEPWASRLAASPDTLVPMFAPDQVEVVVVGGETIASWRILSLDLAAQASIDEWR